MVYKGIGIITVFIVSVVGYALTVRTLNSLTRSLFGHANSSVKNLYWYPATLLITLIPEFVSNIAYDQNDSNPWLQYPRLLFTHSMGFTNALVYGVQSWFALKQARKGKERQEKAISLSSSY